MNVFLSIKILNGNKVIDKQILHFLIDLVEAIKMRKESQMSDHLTRSYKLRKNMSKSNECVLVNKNSEWKQSNR